jgi:hypothetical protein
LDDRNYKRESISPISIQASRSKTGKNRLGIKSNGKRLFELILSNEEAFSIAHALLIVSQSGCSTLIETK